MKLNNIGEFGLIATINRRFEDMKQEGVIGIGDDCAIIPLDSTRSLVITTDMLIENKHFILDKITPYELGYKSLAVNLSDVASMGAKPYVTLLSIALSNNINSEWVDEFIAGYHSLSEKYNTPLIGGDTTSATEGGVAISVTAIGIVDNCDIKQRSGAKASDIIAVTAPLGGSSLALKMILNGETPSQTLRALHYTPRPHIEEGVWLAKQSAVNSMMDISDGIASDLGHIAKLSNIATIVDIDRVPVNSEVIEVCNSKGWDSLSLALGGGEEYSLLLTVNNKYFSVLQEQFRNEFNRELLPIGYCTDGEGVNFISGDKGVVDLELKGFTHF